MTTTATPGATTTAGAGAGSGGAGGGSGAGSGGGSGDVPTVTGSIEDPSGDGAPQNPNSYQFPVSAKLTLKWSSTNADTVDINPLGTGLGASGQQDIPTQDANYALTAKGKGGTSQPFNIEVHTHPDGAVVSAHVDVGTGVAAVISFSASKDNATITGAKVGDTITLTAIVSDATASVTINGKAADLTEQSNGQKQAVVTLTIDASSDGNFEVEAMGSGAGSAVDSQQHVDIIPADATGAGSGAPHDGSGAGTHDHTGAGTHDATGAGTHDHTGAGTHDATGAGTHDHTGAGTHDGTGAGTHDHTGAGTHDATGAGTHDGTGGTGTAEPELIRAYWSDFTDGTGAGSGGGGGGGSGSHKYKHGTTAKMNADASGDAENKTVYFELHHSDDGTTFHWIKEMTAPVQNHTASVVTDLNDPDGSGAGSGGGGSGANVPDLCHWRFYASFTAGSGAGK